MASKLQQILLFSCIFFFAVNGLDCGIDLLVPQLRSLTEICHSFYNKNEIYYVNKCF